MQRGLYNTVTIPVLIPCENKERHGTVCLASPNATRQVTLAMFRPVRVLGDADLKQKSEFWHSLAAHDRERWLALIGLWWALEADDRLSVEKREKAYGKLIGELLSPGAGMPQSGRLLGRVRSQTNFQKAMAKLFAQRGKSLAVLERLLTHALDKARLVLWREEKSQRLLPAIYSPDVATALYVRALFSFAGGNALSICPHCGNPFLQKRSDQDYCSIRCREAHRVARWRATKIAKAKKKGEKHGTSKEAR